MKEYETTSIGWTAVIQRGEVEGWDLPNPVPPDGNGWRLVSSTSVGHPTIGVLVWFWERDVSDSAERIERELADKRAAVSPPWLSDAAEALGQVRPAVDALDASEPGNAEPAPEQAPEPSLPDCDEPARYAQPQIFCEPGDDDSGGDDWRSGVYSAWSAGGNEVKYIRADVADQRVADARKYEREVATEKVKNLAAKALQEIGVEIVPSSMGFGAALVATFKTAQSKTVADALDELEKMRARCLLLYATIRDKASEKRQWHSNEGDAQANLLTWAADELHAVLEDTVAEEDGE